MTRLAPTTRPRFTWRRNRSQVSPDMTESCLGLLSRARVRTKPLPHEEPCRPAALGRAGGTLSTAVPSCICASHPPPCSHARYHSPGLASSFGTAAQTSVDPREPLLLAASHRRLRLRHPDRPPPPARLARAGSLGHPCLDPERLQITAERYVRSASTTPLKRTPVPTFPLGQIDGPIKRRTICLNS